MTKTGLAARVAEKLGIKKKDAAQVVNFLFETIKEALKAGESVNIVGFGSFKVVQRAAREGRNPVTGEVIEIPAKKVVKFKAGKKLKEI
ncbi:MAG: HU family DNA-binding protein [Candidatus Desulfofervidaceae bacterium]|nr:HU family DNA-binding protein [Candidatus Desulfofervidaceae bacterium]